MLLTHLCGLILSNAAQRRFASIRLCYYSLSCNYKINLLSKGFTDLIFSYYHIQQLKSIHFYFFIIFTILFFLIFFFACSIHTISHLSPYSLSISFFTLFSIQYTCILFQKTNFKKVLIMHKLSNMHGLIQINLNIL